MRPCLSACRFALFPRLYAELDLMSFSSLSCCGNRTMKVEIPVPSDVTKRKTKLDLDPAGASMHLSFSNRPDFEPLEGKFKALISPLDSVWMLGEP